MRQDLKKEQKSLKQLVERLHVALSEGAVGANAVGETEMIRMIDEVAASGSIMSVVYLLSCLTVDKPNIADAAAAAIARICADMTAADFVKLDEKVRGPQWSTFRYRERWDNHRQELVTLMRRFEPQAVFMGLASMHRDGRVRELALGALELVIDDDGREIPFLLIRLTDWVSLISVKAKKALKKRVYFENAGHFLKNIALIDRMRQRKRGDAAALLQSIQELTLQARTEDFLRELQNKDHRARRLCFYLGLGMQGPGRTEIIKAGLNNSDQVVRQIALVSSAQFGKEEFLLILEEALKDPLPFNRKEALRLLINQYPEQLTERLKTAALDKSATVRNFARYHLKAGDPGFDFAQFYRDRLRENDPKTLTFAIAGLAETGKFNDFSIVELFLKNSNDQIKKISLHSLVLLDKERTVPHLLEFLQSDSLSLRSQAKKGLLKCTRYVQSGELWRVYSANKNTDLRRAILRVFVGLPMWESLGYFLLACKTDDQKVSDLALEYVKQWQAKHYSHWRNIKPTKPQAERIRLAAPVASKYIAGLKFRELHLVIESV